MTNHQHASLERPQRTRQRIHGLNIKMIGRFVQNKDMRIRKTQTRERNSGFLTSGQQSHFLQASRPCDAESSQVASVFLVLFTGIVLRHEADGAGVHVEGVDVVLGEEANSQTRVLGYEADRGLELADEEFEDGSFACAVGADDADAGVELDVEVDVLEEGFFG